MIPERSGLIIWVSDLKPARNLERYGVIHYMSKRMQYVVLYIHSEKEEELTKQIARLPYVKKVERSLRNEIPTDYNSNMPDKTRFYTF
jgi:uncharacterized protein YlbG (UPF0298 family)